MNHLIWLLAPIGILCTAVVLGTDVFFLSIGRSALRLASVAAGTEVMGYFHLFADARMPIWGVLAILCDVALAVLLKGDARWLVLVSVVALVLFVVLYNSLSKPINRVLIEAAKTGTTPTNGRELQASWDRSLLFRVPLLVLSVLAQCFALLLAGA